MAILKSVVKTIKARQILTSRGIPTVEVEFVMESCSLFSSVPSGKSVGSMEACIHTDRKEAYGGMSVYDVIEQIGSYKETLLNGSIESPEKYDDFLLKLDGTATKKRLGSNFVLPLSICCYKLCSYLSGQSLWRYFASKSGKKEGFPLPNFNLLNGGLHSGNELSCQEIMVCFDRGSYSENLEAACCLFQSLKSLIAEKFGSIYQSVGDEGGFAPPIKDTWEGIELLIAAGKRVHISDFRIAMDFAANSFYKDEKYSFDGDVLSGKQLADRYLKICDEYKIIYSIEDPFAESDFESWKYFYEKSNNTIRIVADDLTVTNTSLIRKYSSMKMFNTVLIKPNQIGSVTETIEAINLCNELGYRIMVSHRSAETEDTFVSSLAVGVSADYVKFGAPCRGERISKYNELLRIEEEFNK